MTSSPPDRYTIFFDFETDSVDPATTQPIQLAAIAVRESDWKEMAAFEVKIKFDDILSDRQALDINHYDPEIWGREAIAWPVVVQRFIAFSKPYLSVPMVSQRTGSKYYVGKLAGHNAAAFDLPILRRMFAGMFFPFSYHVKDTLQRSLWFFDEHPEVTRPENLKLSTLCQSFGVCTDMAHDALADVRMSAALAQCYAKHQSPMVVKAVL